MSDFTTVPGFPEDGIPVEGTRYRVKRGVSSTGWDGVTLVRPGNDRKVPGKNGETKYPDKAIGIALADLPVVLKALAEAGSVAAPEGLAASTAVASMSEGTLDALAEALSAKVLGMLAQD